MEQQQVYAGAAGRAREDGGAATFTSAAPRLTRSSSFLKSCAASIEFEELSTERRFRYSASGETMQNNAFLSQPITIASNVSWGDCHRNRGKGADDGRHQRFREHAARVSERHAGLPCSRLYRQDSELRHIFTSCKDKGYALSDLIGLDGVEKDHGGLAFRLHNAARRQARGEIDRYGAVSRTLSSTEATDGTTSS